MNTSVEIFFGDLLRQFRKRRRFNQKQLAAKIGASRETVSLWERGQYKPETDTILYELVRVLGLTEQEQQQLFEAYTVTALKSSFHNPPLGRNCYFTGRGLQLTDLHTLLMAGKQVALTQAISGLGGIGKTQLALEYAYRYQKSYHDIFWVTADTYNSLITSYVRLAAILNLPEYNEQDQSKVKAAVQQWLSRHKGWLLILDNIEDLSLVHEFVPVDRQGAVLLTTRRQVTEPVAQALELGPLPENDAILFLLKRTNILNFDMSLENASAHDIAMARTITQALGNLPLALDQAGAYILETGCSFANYLDLFQKHQAELLRRRVGEGIPIDHPESVTKTFTLNFKQVQQRSEIAGEMLRVCTFLAPDDIGEEIFVQGASELGPILQPIGTDDLLLNQVIEVLRAFSLIQRDPKNKTFSIHRLVQAVLKDEMSEEDRNQRAEQVVKVVAAAFPHSEPTNWSQCERCLTHAQQCAKLIAQENMAFPEATTLLNETGLYLSKRARYKEALPLLQLALTTCEQQFGPDNLNTAGILHNLADLYEEQGKYEAALLLQQRALAICEQLLSPNHPNTARCLKSLGMHYHSLYKYEQAEPLYRRALAINEQQSGPNTPETASTLHDLAALYREQGKYEQAEPLLLRALAIDEQQLGPNHPAIATNLNNLVLLYLMQGKHEQAEPLVKRALVICEQQLGPDHPDTVSSVEILSLLYLQQGKDEEALTLFRRAIAIHEQQLGLNFSGKMTILDNLTLLYNSKSEVEVDLSLYERMLAISEKLNLNPFETATRLGGLACLYQEQGKFAEAEQLFQRALAIREQQLGADHPETATSLSNLAYLYREQGKYEQAEPLLQRALAIREQQLGADHPETATSLSNLVLFYCIQGKYEQAEPAYRRAATFQEHYLWPQHPETAEIVHNFASFQYTQGNKHNAESLYQRALALREQFLGQHHPKTAETRMRYAALLREMGRQDEAAILESLQLKHPQTEEEKETPHEE